MDRAISTKEKALGFFEQKVVEVVADNRLP